MFDNFARSATVHRVIDGDTFVMEIDLGYTARVRVRIRLKDFSAAELSQAEGAYAKQRSALLLSSATNITVHSFKAEGVRSFERWVAEIYLDVDGVRHSLARLLQHSIQQLRANAPKGH